MSFQPRVYLGLAVSGAKALSTELATPITPGFEVLVIKAVRRQGATLTLLADYVFLPGIKAALP